MENETAKWKDILGSLLHIFKDNNDYTVKHFKMEEKINQVGDKDHIQISIIIEIVSK